MTPHALRLRPLVGRVSSIDWLYERYFIGATKRVSTEPSGDASFVAELAAACEGASFWRPGFTLASRVGKGAFVDGPVRLWIESSARGLRPARARVGAPVSVLMPCVREAAMSGFVGFNSRAGGLDHSEPHLKLYVNALPEGALALFGALASIRRHRFDAKTLNDPRLFGRRDTVLIYSAVDDSDALTQWVRTFMRSHAELFRDEIPPLIRRVARGLGVAESPFDTDESFGAHRCRLIVEGLRTAKLEKRDWNECIAERFERDGLDWDRPWLRGDSQKRH